MIACRECRGRGGFGAFKCVACDGTGTRWGVEGTTAAIVVVSVVGVPLFLWAVFAVIGGGP